MNSENRVRSGEGTSSSQSQAVTINGVGPQARSHPLFPIIDYLAKTVHQNHQTLLKIDGKVNQQERQLSSLASAVQELKELQQKNEVKSFSLKSSGYEKPLRSGIADLFCDSITREISDSSINDLVKKVFKSDIKHRHKVDEALKYCKKLISTFRTEERRRILGVPPCQTYKELDTKSLSKVMLDYFKASSANTATYFKHLAILRKFVREDSDPRQIKSFYVAFKEWTSKFYPTGVDWNSLITEDEAFHYQSASGSVEIDDSSLQTSPLLDLQGVVLDNDEVPEADTQLQYSFSHD